MRARARRARSSSRSSTTATLDRATFRLALMRALAAARGRAPVARDAARREEGPEDRRGDHRQDARRLVQGTSSSRTRSSLELLAEGHARRSSRRRRIRSSRPAQRIWPIVQGRGEEGRRARRASCSLVVADVRRRDEAGARRRARARREPHAAHHVRHGEVAQARLDRSWPTGRSRSASQILAKDTGKEPFNSPPKLLAAIKAKKFGPYADPALGGELPINFESDLDITGGNSGSPTLNDKGELVGLAFDGNKEGLASDVVFNGDDHAHDPRRRALHDLDDGRGRPRRQRAHRDGREARLVMLGFAACGTSSRSPSSRARWSRRASRAPTPRRPSTP